MKHFSNVFRFGFILSLVFSSFGYQNLAEGHLLEKEQIVSFERGENQTHHIISGSQYQVVQNTDPTLMALALQGSATINRFGPNRNDPARGIPKHAYSPFDDIEKAEVCPPGGCDYVQGRLLVKFEPEQTFEMVGDQGMMPESLSLTTALKQIRVQRLSPLFPYAKKPAIGSQIQSVDGELIPEPDLTRWFMAEIDASTDLGAVVQELLVTDGIDWVEPDFIRKPIGSLAEQLGTVLPSSLAAQSYLPGPLTDPLYDQQWHLAATYVPEAWAYLESQGLPAGGHRDIVVAVIDTGVDYTHPDLAANIWINPAEFNGIAGVDDDANGYVDDIHGADTVYPDGNPIDDHGHGTHVSGIIASQAENGIGGVGVAYNVQIMPIKAAQYSGILASSDIAEGIFYAVAKGADVINMSFGGYAKSLIEEDALTVAFGQAVLVAAAGNDSLINYPCYAFGDMYPAAYNWVLGVMASGTENQLAEFSNRDCAPKDTHEYELMAPGVDIWSTLPNNQYAAWDGTSMSAPVVSGIAALARTQWSDKDIYSSRFIMGQIASNTTSTSSFGVVNTFNTLTQAPEPELSYLEHLLFDSPNANPINDDDGIVDAGETVELAITVRNYWGKAENVIVTLEAWADGAVLPDPYVTMLIDSVDYGAIGSFNWDDNGLIYDDQGEITGVQNPFKFSVSMDVPNDHLIPFRLTMTADNGYDPEDPDSPYSFTDYFYLMVQKGTQVPQIISSDLTLTKDRLWIIDRPVLVESGVIVNVDPGTQIQFWSTEPADPYATLPASFLQVEGHLFINGTQDEPVEIFPSLQYSNYKTEIRRVIPSGKIEIRYVKAMNPGWGKINLSNNFYMFNLIDHARFYQSNSHQLLSLTDTHWGSIVNSAEIYNSHFNKLGIKDLSQRLEIFSGEQNLFDNCLLQKYDPHVLLAPFSLKNNVFLKNYLNDQVPFDAVSFLNYAGTRTYAPTFLKAVAPQTNLGKTYFAIPIFLTPLEVAEKFANVMGGHVVTISDVTENDFILNYLQALPVRIPEDLNCGEFDCVEFYSEKLWLGLHYKEDIDNFVWTSGEPYSYSNWYYDQPYTQPLIGTSGRYYFTFLYSNGYWYNRYETPFYNYSTDLGSWLLEIPGEWTLSQIEALRSTFIAEANFGQFQDNAILNLWWDPAPSHWMQFKALGFSGELVARDIEYYISNNYWKTTSRALIDSSIVDFHDDFNLPKIIYEPIQEIPSEDTYPFVVDIVTSTASNPDTSVVGAEPITFTVTFNRDMNQAIQPMVSFGPDIPMTDYTIHPIDGGWRDARTWVGTFNINPITGDGYQLIRVAGAVDAVDPWLVTGDDAGRFRFEIITSGTEAMNLQATGGEGYVDLSWTQDDFDLLAGFNLYRSTSLDGTYSRINTSIIPPDVRTFRDINVIPGQPYYYKFTIVKSDMTESNFSNVAQATPLDTIPPVLVHTPITWADPGLPLTIPASVTDNVAVTGVTLYYRHIGDIIYLNKVMVKTTGDSYYATIEGSLLTSPGIEYYLEATDGISITRNGRPENPNIITVDDQPVITIVTPNAGSSDGGTAVTISGSNFKEGATVTFGSASATNVIVVSSNQITCLTPAHFPATVDVRVTNPDAQYGVLLSGFTFESASAQISLPNTGGGTGNVVTVPVNAANLHGLVAASLTVTFDPEVLSALSASTGSLTAGWSFVSNLTTPGQIRMSMISPGGGIDGSGILANIEFEVIGAPGTNSPLVISNILLNDGAIPVDVTNGLFSVDNVYGVSGSIIFWNGGLPVPGTELTLTGDRTYNAISGSDGAYTIQGAAIDAYNLEASKSDADSGISAYDASLTMQHDVGLITLTGYAALAGDVNRSGAITSMDAYYILQKSVGLISLPFPGSGTTWIFDPPQRTIPQLTSNLTGQNFTAILLGDVSGNWSQLLAPTGLSSIQSTLAASASLTVQSTSFLPNQTLNVPIYLAITDASLFGADLSITYDPAHITISQVSLGSLAAGWSIASNLASPGVVKIALAGATPITSNGELVVLSVTAVGTAGTQSEIAITQGDLNEGAIPSTLLPGVMHIAVPVVAEFSASPTSGTAPLMVSFTNLSTGDWTTALWDFGDGYTSTSSNPTHQYSNAGAYTVSLTVSGAGGTNTKTLTNYIQVSTISITGNIQYWAGDQSIPDALLQLSGSTNYNTSTDDLGDFVISSVQSGDYTLTPSKSDGINGITAYDAALVLRHAAELITMTGDQATAADVDGSGTISSLDASLILQKSVGIITTYNPEAPDMWVFNPASRVYADLSSNQIDQNFTGILLGDPSGNWAGNLSLQRPSTDNLSAILQIEATAPDAQGNVVATIILDPNSNEIFGIDLELTYDPNHASVKDISIGNLSGWLLATNTTQPGVIRLGLADTQALVENAAIVTIQFQLKDLGRVSQFLPRMCLINEGAVSIIMSGATLGSYMNLIYLPMLSK